MASSMSAKPATAAAAATPAAAAASEWTTVTRAMRKGRRRSFNGSNGKHRLATKGSSGSGDGPHHNHDQQQHHRQLHDGVSAAEPATQEAIEAEVLDLMQLQQRLGGSTWFQQVAQGLAAVLKEAGLDGERCVHEVVSYGIGSFVRRGPIQNNARYQLACLGCIRQLLEGEPLGSTARAGAAAAAPQRGHQQQQLENQEQQQEQEQQQVQQEQCTAGGGEQEQRRRVACWVFDPVMSHVERAVLQRLGYSVITKNEQGKRRTARTTLFFMPHCPERLYSNLLWANWGVPLSQLVILGNSFAAYGDRHAALARSASSTGCDNCVLRLLPLCAERSLGYSRAAHAASVLPHLERAFNDLAAVTFPRNVLESAEGSSVLALRPAEYADEHEGGELITGRAPEQGEG